MLTIKKYDNSMYNDMLLFSKKAVDDGLLNNSIERMNLDSVHYWVAYYKNKIIAVSGIQYRDGAWWIVRQATLHKYHKLLGFKKLFGGSSIAAKYLQPESVKWCQSQNDDDIYLSVNIDNHAGPWMSRVNKHVNKFANLGLFKYLGCQKIKGVYQDVFIVDKKGFWEYVHKLQRLDDDIKEIK